jgi:hypothetical protein
MNCLDFHRLLLADPFSKDEAALAHEAECEACAGFARELRAQEVQLRALLQSPKAPEGLADRVRLAAGFEQRAADRRRWWYAAAAGVLLSIGVSMVSVVTTSLERSHLVLAQSVLDHIDDESHHLREVGPVSGGRLKYVFKRFGADLVADIGQVNFAAECLMRTRNGVHLVIPGERGPVTVFFMPDEHLDAPVAVDSERFDGTILPTPWGSLALVGENGEQLDGLGDRLLAAVAWPAPAPRLSGIVDRGHRLVALTRQQQDG